MSACASVRAHTSIAICSQMQGHTQKNPSYNWPTRKRSGMLRW